MARVLQIRRGSAAQNNNFTGMPGELSFDTDAKTVRVHDGAMLGGYALARADQIQQPAGPGDAFDINSVPDEFWADIVARFAPASLTVLTSRDVPVRATTGIEYIFNTELTPHFATADLVCAATDAGYAVGDVVSAFGFGAYPATRPNVYRSASGVHACMLIGGQQPWVRHHQTGVVTNITAGAWKLRFRLYC